MILSNDRANSIAARLGRGVVTVVPVTSNTDLAFPFQALLPVRVTALPQDSKARAEQVRSVAVEPLGAIHMRDRGFTHSRDTEMLHFPDDLNGLLDGFLKC